MDVRDMKTLEIIFAVQCPMRLKFVFASAGQHRTKKLNVRELLGRVIYKRRKRCDGVHRSEHKPGPGREGQLSQVVRLGRKILDILKLRH